MDGERIWLTFDDGPSTDITPLILHLLARHNISATFFVRGESALRYSDLIRQILDEGHRVANHTMTHADRTTLAASEIEAELARASEAIAKIAGAPPRWFRPPFGHSGLARYLLHEILISLGATHLLWRDPAV